MPRRVRGMARTEDVKKRHEAELMKIKDVEGVAIGEKDGKTCLVVYVAKDSPRLREAIPRQIEGVEVRIEESGEFVALAP
jgi:hypothetical protein